MTVLTFGAITDLLGKNRLEMDSMTSTEELKTKLENAYPGLKNISYAIAVNMQMVTGPVTIEPNATIALLPPFSGG